jgi:hypothetical protein
MAMALIRSRFSRSHPPHRGTGLGTGARPALVLVVGVRFRWAGHARHFAWLTVPGRRLDAEH